MNKEEYVKQYMDKHAGSAYMTGAPAALKHGFELALGFAEWLEENRWLEDNLAQHEHTTQELFEIYLNTKK